MRNFLDRPQSVFVRRALFQVHLWIGVFAGLYVFVVCVTGAALVFRIDMQRALHPDLFTQRVEGPPANPVDVMETVKREYPGEPLSGVDAPTTARPTYLAYTGTGDRFRTLLLDPVSAELLGELSDPSFVRTLQDLHFDLLAGSVHRRTAGADASRRTHRGRRHHGLGGATACGELRRRWRESRLARSGTLAADALRHRFHHVVDAREATPH